MYKACLHHTLICAATLGVILKYINIFSKSFGFVPKAVQKDKHSWTVQIWGLVWVEASPRFWVHFSYVGFEHSRWYLILRALGYQPFGNNLINYTLIEWEKPSSNEMVSVSRLGKCSLCCMAIKKGSFFWPGNCCGDCCKMKWTFWIFDTILPFLSLKISELQKINFLSCLVFTWWYG